MRAGDQSLRIEHGRAVRHRPAWLNQLLSLPAQMLLAGFLALAPAIEMISRHIGGPTPPEVAVVPLATLTVAYALFYLFIYVPRTAHDLQVTADWLESVFRAAI